MLKRLLVHDNFPILILILINLLVGAWVVRDYGESWDERSHFQYGQDALNAYLGRANPKDLELDEKGPSYAMMAVLGSEILQAVTSWRPMESWHFIHFTFFQLGLFFLYRLCRRISGKTAAIGATLLFNTQPLLWGHAFINPKDISFMAFFMGSIELGLELASDPRWSSRNSNAWLPMLKNWRVGLAALFLGLTCSMRVIGPLAGLIVACYILVKHGRRSLPMLVVYGGLATGVMFLTWPGLWRSPLVAYWRSLRIASEFPLEGKVLFGGQEYDRDKLPRLYLPTLMSIQFSESVLILFAAGLGCAGWQVYQQARHWRQTSQPGHQAVPGDQSQNDVWFLILLAGWLLVPVIAVVMLQPNLYDNFRHFLFITPPMFVFAALALQYIFKRLSQPFIQAGLLALIILPSLYGLVKLHPYQYIYYNSLVGGTDGAFRRFELDYWLTAYKQATEYLNTTAPDGASVVTWGAPQLVKHYDTGNFRVLDYQKLPKDGPPPAGYAIISSRLNKDQTVYPDAPVLFEVRQGGVILAVVKILQTSSSASP